MNEKGRHSQRMASVCAIAILVSLLLLLPIGGSFADYMNAANAPDAESTRYAEISTFNMDTKAFKSDSSWKSYYIWKNATGYLNYNNVTHSAGVISVAENSTVNNGITGNISWTQMYPYFEIYFDYTAKQAYDDNVVRIWLQLSSLYVSANAYARTITLSAGDVTFYTTTLAKTDTDNTIDTNITVDVNDLRSAIINAQNNSFWKLTITSQDTTLSIAGSGMLAYNCNKLIGRDDALYLVVGLAAAAAFAGVFLVQPKYSLPFGGQKERKGGY